MKFWVTYSRKVTFHFPRQPREFETVERGLNAEFDDARCTFEEAYSCLKAEVDRWIEEGIIEITERVEGR